jgi:hypothetical protein
MTALTPEQQRYFQSLKPDTTPQEVWDAWLEELEQEAEEVERTLRDHFISARRSADDTKHVPGRQPPQP